MASKDTTSAQDHYACPCLNVRVIVDRIDDNGSKDVKQEENQGFLLEDRAILPGKECQISISQPLLTSRIISSSQPSQQASTPLTTLHCLNCKAAVYTVDKTLQRHQSTSKTTLGFDRLSSGAASLSPSVAKATGKPSSASPSPVRNAEILSNNDDGDILRPDPSSGTLWILRGCREGKEAISKMISSDSYSAIFGLKTERVGDEAALEPPEELVAEEGSGKVLEAKRHVSSTFNSKRTVSPGRPFHSSADDSSSMSPSPARRKTKAWAAHRTEEEEGDDLDTLHLLENLLPPMPTSLLIDSIAASSSQAGMNNSLSPRRGNISLSSSSYFPTQNASTAQKKLELQLDASAMAELRAQHDLAKMEIHELLKTKRRELGQLQQRMKGDARRLMGRRSRSNSKESMQRMTRMEIQRQDDTHKTGPKSEAETSVSAESGGSPLFERRRPLIPSSVEMGRSNSQNTQSDSVFSGTPTTSTSGGLAMASQAGVGSSSIGSHLSASFAMRGRDPPQTTVIPKKEIDDLETLEDEEEWYAQKRRLRERYPHADHSALPSAVNSDDEGNVELKKGQKSDAEDERRGRGRDRAAARDTVNEANKVEEAKSRREDKSNRKPRSPSPLEQDSDRKTTSSDDLSKSLNVKKGALKVSTPSRIESQTKSPNTGGEKKVAFAEAPKVTVAPQEPKKIVDEGADAVFEIDEEMDEDEMPVSSNTNLDNRALAKEKEKNALQDAQTEDEKFEAQGADEPFDNIAQSLPTVGSFSAAMATSERTRMSGGEREEDDFDPASLRLEDEVVYSSQRFDASMASNARSKIGNDSSDSIDDTSIYGSRPRPRRRQSVDPPDTLLSGFPQTPQERSSTIGFRVAVGEAEAQLSGLLAPHAPSHRNLWSMSSKQKLRLNGKDKEKYALPDEAEEEELDEEDKSETGWSAWQRRAQEAKRKTTNDDDDGIYARSVPIGIIGTLSPENRGLDISSTKTTTTFQDKNSGFDLEPKTSLPYQEKKFTPSLRKATRHLVAPGASQGQRLSLSTISDASETAGSNISSVDAPQTAAMQIGSLAKANRTTAKPVIAPSNFQYSVPASVTRGFQSHPLQSNTVPSSTQSTPMLGSTETGFSDHVGGRRSILRGPYVQPPPPSTSQLRLQPSDQHRPTSVDLESVKVELGFATHEGNEDDVDHEDLEKDLKFMHILEQLKTNKRTGWFHHRISHPESIADHMYRMATLSMLLPNVNLDIGKCVQLCLVHDIAEALVGDLTPLDGVSKEEKLNREREALLYLVHDLLGGSPAALRIEKLWMEYEDRDTLESKAVKDLDRFELGLQAVEYEQRYNITDLQPFFEGSLGNITHPRIRKWARQLAKEREKVWEQTPYKYQQAIPNEA